MTTGDLPDWLECREDPLEEIRESHLSDAGFLPKRRIMLAN